MSYINKVNVNNTAYDIASRIYYGAVDSTSTATAFTVSNVDGITEYYAGLAVYIFNGVVATASGITININGLGAKNIYRSNGNAVVTTHWAKNTGFILVYNPARDNGAGAWDWQSGYDTDSVGTNLYFPYATIKANGVAYRYHLIFQDSEETFISANAVSDSTAATKVLTTQPFMPFGMIGYNNANIGDGVTLATIYMQYLVDLRYSFNTAKTLITGRTIYLKCTPLANGMVRFAEGNPIVQDLPTTEDGYVYITLGQAYDNYRLQLSYVHNVLYFKDGAIKLWTGSDSSNLPEISETQPYVIQRTGGSHSPLADEYNALKRTHLTGGSLVWNQLVQINDGNMGIINGVTFTHNADGSIRVHGTAEALVQKSISNAFNLINGHKYFISGIGDGGATKWDTRIGTTATFQNGINYTFAKGDILSCIGDVASSFTVTVRSGATIDATFYPVCADLTKVFGTTFANAIYSMSDHGVAWLYATFPELNGGFIPYSAPHFEHSKYKGVTSNGVNQFNGQTAEGYYNTTTGAFVSENRYICSDDLFKCLPNTTYYLKFKANTSLYVLFYDINKNFIPPYSQVTGNTTFTTPSNAYYMTWWQSKANYGSQTYQNDVGFYIHYDSSYDDIHEDYESWHTALGSDVLKGIPVADGYTGSNVWSGKWHWDGDTKTPDGVIMGRAVEIDFSNLTFTLNTNDVRQASIANYPALISDTMTGEFLCENYTPIRIGNYPPKEGQICINSGSRMVFIKSSSAPTGKMLGLIASDYTTSQGTAYEENEQCHNWGIQWTEDAEYIAGNRDFRMPMGGEEIYTTVYQVLKDTAPLPPSANGKYVLSHENGNNEYKQIPDITWDSEGNTTFPANVSANEFIGSGNQLSDTKIFFGTVDNTSTATAFTSQITGITKYYDGLAIYMYNGKVASIAGTTLNVNGLGAKGIYQSNANNAYISGGLWAVNTGYILIYNSSRNSNNGGWDLQTGYNIDSYAYNVYTPYGKIKADGVSYRYHLIFQSSETTVITPNAVQDSVATTKTITSQEFDPFGIIGYNPNTVANNAEVAYIYYQILLDLRYSFNTGTSLTAAKTTYVRCIPQVNGKVKFDGDNCIVQALPTTEDGYVYITLGQAYDNYRVYLMAEHPVYFFKDGAVRIWTNNSADYPVVTEKSAYNYRKSGDSGRTFVGVLDGQSEYDIVYGTVSYNQLVTNGNFADGTTGWYASQGTIAVSNNKCTYTKTGTSVGSVMHTLSVAPILNHIYYLSAIVTPVKAINSGFYLGDATTASVPVSANTRTLVTALKKITSAPNSSLYVYTDRTYVLSANDTVVVENVNCVDLTQWFGNPDIAEELLYLNTQTAGLGLSLLQKTFRCFCGYMPTDTTGTLMSCNPSYHKTTNRNIWDEQWELGSYDTSGEKFDETTVSIRSKTKFRVTPSETYTISKLVQGGIYCFEYDINENFIRRQYSSSNDYSYNFTVSSNCCFIAFCCGNSMHPILSGDGIELWVYQTSNTIKTYTPHEEITTPIAPVEGHGLYKMGLDEEFYCDGDVRHSNGAFDEKYKTVDLSTLNWITLYPDACVYGAKINDIQIPATLADRLRNFICGKYMIDTVIAVNENMTDKSCKRYDSSASQFVIRDTTYTNSTDFVASLAGVYLTYPVATPVTKQVTPFSVPQQVWTNGTEQFNDYDYDNNQRSVELPVGVDATYYSTARYVEDKSISTLLWEDI